MASNWQPGDVYKHIMGNSNIPDINKVLATNKLKNSLSGYQYKPSVWQADGNITSLLQSSYQQGFSQGKENARLKANQKQQKENSNTDESTNETTNPSSSNVSNDSETEEKDGVLTSFWKSLTDENYANTHPNSKAAKVGSNLRAGTGDVLEDYGNADKFILERIPDVDDLRELIPGDTKLERFGIEMLKNVVPGLGQADLMKTAVEKGAEGLQYAGQTTKKGYDDIYYEPSSGEFKITEAIKDPNFYATTVTRQIPQLVTSLVGGGIGYKAAGNALASTGMKEGLKRTALQSIMGSTLMTLQESGAEAYRTQEELEASGVSEQEARKKANGVFLKNLAMLTASNSLEVGTAFSPVKGLDNVLNKNMAQKILKEGATAVGKGVTSGLSEATEEVLQNKFSGDAKGEEFDLFSPENKESALAGFVIGAGFGAGGHIAERTGMMGDGDTSTQTDNDPNSPNTNALSTEVNAKQLPSSAEQMYHQVVRDMPESLQNEHTTNIQGYKASGMNQTQAEIQSMKDLLVKHEEELTPYVEKAVATFMPQETAQSYQQTDVQPNAQQETQESPQFGETSPLNVNVPTIRNQTLEGNSGQNNSMPVSESGQTFINETLTQNQAPGQNAPQAPNDLLLPQQIEVPDVDFVLDNGMTIPERSMNEKVYQEITSQVKENGGMATPAMIGSQYKLSPDSVKAIFTDLQEKGIYKGKFVGDTSAMPIEQQEQQIAEEVQPVWEMTATDRQGNKLRIGEQFMTEGSSVPYEVFGIGSKSNVEYVVAKDASGKDVWIPSANAIKVTAQVPVQEQVQNELSAQKEDAPVNEMGASQESTAYETTVETPAGTKVKVQYEVIELADAVASNDYNGNANPDYPEELQPRSRERQASVQQTTSIVANLNPERLTISPLTSEGAPIVSDGAKNVVESGNGRMMALERMYAQDQYKKQCYKYIVHLTNLMRKGLIPRVDIRKFAQPVLVRKRTESLNLEERMQLTQESNISTVSEMSATEMAKQDASNVKGFLDQYNPALDGGLLSPKNKQFVQTFLQKVVGQANLNKYVTENGALSQDGMQRIQYALFALAYPDNTMLQTFTEATDANARNVITSLTDVSPFVAIFHQNIQKGEIDQAYSFQGDIIKAFNRYMEMKREGMNQQQIANWIDEDIGQTSLFEKESETYYLFLQQMNQRRGVVKKLRGLLYNYTEYVSNDPLASGNNLLGEKAANIDYWAVAEQRLNGGDLFEIDAESQAQTENLQTGAEIRGREKSQNTEVKEQQVKEGTPNDTVERKSNGEARAETIPERAAEAAQTTNEKIPGEKQSQSKEGSTLENTKEIATGDFVIDTTRLKDRKVFRIENVEPNGAAVIREYTGKENYSRHRAERVSKRLLKKITEAEAEKHTKNYPLRYDEEGNPTPVDKHGEKLTVGDAIKVTSLDGKETRYGTVKRRFNLTVIVSTEKTTNTGQFVAKLWDVEKVENAEGNAHTSSKVDTYIPPKQKKNNQRKSTFDTFMDSVAEDKTRSGNTDTFTEAVHENNFRTKKEDIQRDQEPAKESKKKKDDGYKESGQVSRSNIITYIVRNFNVKMGIGKYREKYRAIYKKNKSIMRSKAFADFVAVTHELGHHLTDKYHLDSDSQYHDVLKNIANENLEIPKGMEDAQIVREGIAEFVRQYVYDRQAAKQQGGEFFTFFEDTLRGDEKYNAAQNLTDLFGRWYGQSAMERVKSTMSVQTKETKQNSIREHLSVEKWIDKYDYLRKFLIKHLGEDTVDSLAAEENPFDLAWVTRGVAGWSELALQDGIYDKDGNVVYDKSMEDIVGTVPDKDTFRVLLYARRALELMNTGKTEPISREDAETVLKEIEALEDYKVYEQAAKDIYDWQYQLKLHTVVEAGMLSEATLKKWAKESPFYIPFKRVMTESGLRPGEEGYVKENGNGRPQGVKFGNLSSAVKAMKEGGSTRNVIDPIESMIADACFYKAIASRNKVGQAMLKLARQHEAIGMEFEELERAGETVDVRESLDKAQSDMEGTEVEEKVNVAMKELFMPKKDEMYVWEDGVQKTVFIRDPQLYNAMLNMNGIILRGFGRLLNYFSIPNRILASRATTSPTFLFRTVFRNMMSVFQNSTNYGTFELPQYMAGLTKAIISSMRKDANFKKWKATGGYFSSLYGVQRSYMKDNRHLYLNDATNAKLKKGATKLMYNVFTLGSDTIRELSEVIDNGVKLNEYNRSLEKGNSATKATVDSRNVDYDTNRSGEYGQIVNRLNLFFNASLQGVYKTGSMIKNPKTRTKFLMKGSIYFTMPTLMLLAANWNDDDYWELSQYERDLFWCIPIGNGKFLKIPIPFEQGMLFKTIPEKIVAGILGNNDKQLTDEQWKEFMATAKEQVLPSLVPTFLDIFVDSYVFGDDGYVDYKASNPNLHEYEKYDNSTSDTLKNLTEGLYNVSGGNRDFNPKSLEKIITGLTTTQGKVTLNILDKITQGSDKEVLKQYKSSVIGDSADGSTKSSDDFYNHLDELEEDHRDNGEPNNPNDTLKLERNRKQFLSDLRKQRQATEQDSSLSTKEKRAKVEEINVVIRAMQRYALGREVTNEEMRLLERYATEYDNRKNE